MIEYCFGRLMRAPVLILYFPASVIHPFIQFFRKKKLNYELTVIFCFSRAFVIDRDTAWTTPANVFFSISTIRSGTCACKQTSVIDISGTEYSSKVFFIYSGNYVSTKCEVLSHQKRAVCPSQLKDFCVMNNYSSNSGGYDLVISI